MYRTTARTVWAAQWFPPEDLRHSPLTRVMWEDTDPLDSLIKDGEIGWTTGRQHIGPVCVTCGAASAVKERLYFVRTDSSAASYLLPGHWIVYDLGRWARVVDQEFRERYEPQEA
jgi:hypothetical protein